jgi:hypothetical protein
MRKNETNVTWTWVDLMDYELLMHNDRTCDSGDRNLRDEAIRKKLLQDSSEPDSFKIDLDDVEERRYYLHQWLEFRRKSHDGAAVAKGSDLMLSLKRAGTILALAGFFLGLLLVAALLFETIVNVQWVLFLYVFPQFLLLVLSIWIWLDRRFRWNWEFPHLALRVTISCVTFIWQKATMLFGSLSQDGTETLMKIKEAIHLILVRMEMTGSAVLLYPLLIL